VIEDYSKKKLITYFYLKIKRKHTMLITYNYSGDKEVSKTEIDKYVSKLRDLEFTGNFKITELDKSWTNSDMQYSLMIKNGSLDRRVRGIIKIKDKEIIINMELPSVIQNFIRPEKLEALIIKHLQIALTKETVH
jgi:hypothetical protein